MTEDVNIWSWYVFNTKFNIYSTHSTTHYRWTAIAFSLCGKSPSYCMTERTCFLQTESFKSECFHKTEGRHVQCVHAKSLHSCPTLCDSMDYNTLSSSVHGIFQVRMLEWVTMPSSRGSSRSRDRTPISCTAGCREWPPTGGKVESMHWGAWHTVTSQGMDSNYEGLLLLEFHCGLKLSFIDQNVNTYVSFL